MRNTTRKIVGVALFSLVAFAGAASAQGYKYPPAPQPAQPPSGPTTHGPVYTINAAMAVVQGRQEKILTDARGFALYYLTADTPTASACTGGCAKIWPPLLSVPAPTQAPVLPGKLSVVNGGNGSQVSYNGHLLYHYSGDTAPGQAAGDGLYGKWFVAKPDLAVSVPRSPSGSSGYSTSGGW